MIDNRSRCEKTCRQHGISLIVTLLMLIAILLLGSSAAQIAAQGMKAARGDRDRQIALQAAEAALQDAEMDIEESPDTMRSRSVHFSERPVLADFDPACGQGLSNIFLGVCVATLDQDFPAWLSVDFSDESASTRSVPFGKFTGQIMQVGKGTLPAKLPRYLIEVIRYRGAGEDAGLQPSYFYRITAIGFGPTEATQVVLQSFYRKADVPTAETRS